MREFVEAMGILHGTVVTILHEKFSMKKLAARWVLRSLTVVNKPNRVTDSTAGLALFRRNLTGFLHGYIIVNETWIRFYTPEIKH